MASMIRQGLSAGGKAAWAWAAASGQQVRRFAAETASGASGASSATAAAAGGGAAKKKMGLGKKLAVGVAGALVVGAVGAKVAAQFDEGIARSQEFWMKAFPIYMHYRLVQWKANNLGWTEEEADKEFEDLHEQYAPVAEQIVLDMKGMYLKNAQLVSTRDEFLPPQYMEFCKRTQDKVPSEFGPGEARAVVEAELGPLDKVFEFFDDEVLGAASIGEVHRARLIGGREVVVKIQYPNIERKFRSDLKTIIAFSELAQPQHVKPLAEIEKQFLTEFDYVGEANNLEEIRKNVMPIWGDRVYIPKAHTHLCTKQVMVMDFVEGVRLVDGLRAQFRKYAESQGRTLEDLEAEMKEKIKRGELAKKSLDEDAAKTRRIQKLVAATDIAKNSGRFVYNWTLGLVTKPKEYKWSDKPINLGEALKLLNEVHAHEIFVDGAFNGDPHPGNIMLMPDGRLGLIDYGQVKRLSTKDRVDYARIIVAIAEGSKEDAIREYVNAGARTKYMKKDIMYRLVCFWNDRDDDDITGGRNIQTFMDWAQAEDPVEDVPENLIMPARVSVLMRGMANAFGLRMRTAPLWLPLAKQTLIENGVDPDSCIVDQLRLDEIKRQKQVETIAKNM